MALRARRGHKPHEEISYQDQHKCGQNKLLHEMKITTITETTRIHLFTIDHSLMHLSNFSIIESVWESHQATWTTKLWKNFFIVTLLIVAHCFNHFRLIHATVPVRCIAVAIATAGAASDQPTIIEVARCVAFWSVLRLHHPRVARHHHS